MKTETLANLAAEEEVLSACLTSPSELYRIADTLSDDCFTDGLNRRLWQLLKRLRSEGKDINATSLHTALFPDKPLLDKYLDIIGKSLSYRLNGADMVLADLLERRRLLAAVCEAQAAVCDLSVPIEDTSESLTKCMTENNAVSSDTTATMADVCQEVIDCCFRNQEGSGTEMATGFEFVDRRGGLHASDLSIIAGETSMGKTSLAMTVAVNVAMSGTPVGIFTLEMSTLQLASRLLASRAMVPGRDILYSRLSADDYNRVGDAVVRMKGLPLFFDRKMRFGQIVAGIRKMVYRHKVKVVVVDYLQYIIPDERRKGASQTQEIGEMCQVFKSLAMELGICVLLLSQLARDRQNPYPTLSRLKGSGDIENSADNVYFVYRPEYYETEGRTVLYNDPYKHVSARGTAEIIQAKGRNVGTGSFIVGYRKEFAEFYDMQQNLLPGRTLTAVTDDEPPF